MRPTNPNPTSPHPVGRTPMGCQPYSPAIDRRFTVLGLLGEGGFAEVFHAVDSNTGADVAIKVIRPEHWGHPVVESLMRTESSALMRIDHPCVPKLVFRPDERRISYFVMEHLPGVSLKLVRASYGGDAGKSIGLGIGVCEVLSSIHGAGIIHRDLKPENILVFGPMLRRVSIVDFGYAKVPLLPDYALSAKHCAGTPEFIAPEQTYFPGSHSDSRTDLYALGVILFELACGRLPFSVNPGGHRAALLRMHRDKQAPPLRSFSSNAPEELCAIVAKALAKNPDERFQSAMEMRDALASCPQTPV